MDALTIILIIIVVILLVSYFYRLRQDYKKNKKRSQRWPPVGSPSTCPDYWIDKGDGVCENPYSLGTGENNPNPIPQYNFSNLQGCSLEDMNNEKCLASKCEWAKKSNNPWFGVLPKCTKGQNCYCPA